jgi:VRR-NUC domain
LTERELQANVVFVARVFGFKCAHFRPAWTRKGWRTPVEGDAVGFPDLVLCAPGRLIFVELKCGRNKLTPEQSEWLEALRAAGQEAHVWTDRDWQTGLVEAELRRERADAA